MKNNWEEQVTQKLVIEKFNKSDQTLAGLTKGKVRFKWLKDSNESRDFTTNLIEIKIILREYYELLYTKFDNVEEMGKFLKKHKFIKTDSRRNICNLSPVKRLNYLSKTKTTCIMTVLGTPCICSPVKLVKIIKEKPFRVSRNCPGSKEQMMY